MCVHVCTLVKDVLIVTFQRTVSSMRRSAGRRSRATSRSVARRASQSAAAADEDDDEDRSSSSMQSTAEDEPTSTAVIAVDVTGAAFARQRAYVQSLRPPTAHRPVSDVHDDSDDDHSAQFASVVRGRPPSSRRSSPARSDYGRAVTGGAVRRVPSVRQTSEPSAQTTSRRRATSETREYRHRRQEMTSPNSTAAVLGQQSRGRTTIRQLKRKNNRPTATLFTAAGGGDTSSICSWRHSLCAGFKSSKCDAEDLWTEFRPEPAPSRPPSTPSSVTVSVVPTTTKPPRSQSLPRSFRSSFIAPLRRLLSSRSLNSTSDVDSGCGVERPSSRRLVRAASDSASSRPPSQAPPPTTDSQPTSKEKLVRRSRSLERGSKQRSISRTVSLNSHSNTSSRSRTNASVSSSSSGVRGIYVEIQPPWIRPTDAVRYRPHRTAHVDRYQSSSGILLLLCLPCLSCQQEN